MWVAEIVHGAEIAAEIVAVGGVLVAVVAVVVGAADVRAAVVEIAGAVGVRVAVVAAEAGTKLLCRE